MTEEVEEMALWRLWKAHFSQCQFTCSVRLKPASQQVLDFLNGLMDYCFLRANTCQVGSLVGAAHLLVSRLVSSTRTEIPCGRKGEDVA